MVDRPLFQGQLVHLTALNPETDAEVLARWSLNSEYLRLLDSDPARPRSSQHISQEIEGKGYRADAYSFAIRTLSGEKLIGRVDLDGIEWPHAAGWIDIGIGDPNYWGKGYGSDAMRELIRFAFTEVSLYRLSLDVFEYNERALHVYEKVGFKVEGRVRGFLERDGKRWDLIYMGLLRPEWQEA